MTSTDIANKSDSSPLLNAKPTLIYLLLVILLTIMVGEFYFFWRQISLRDQQFKEFQQQSESAERSQDKLLQQSKDDQQVFQALLHEELSQLDSRLEKLSRSDRSDWLLAETEYLLRIANQYATLAHDAKTAEALLANADQVMKELEKNIAASKTIVNIRSKIAGERAALKLRGELDKEGLYLQLEALIKQVDQIAVVDIGSMSKKERAAEENSISHEQSISSRMMTSLLRALQKIGGYIRVQNHDQALNEQNRGPLLSLDEQQYLKQNLRLRLEQAQIALMQRHQTVYEISLSDAKNWIKKYYVIDAGLKNKWLTEIDFFSKQNIEEPLPDISGSLTELKSYMLTRHAFNEKSVKH